ncbi:hypothetical protein V1227_14735 [Lentzea sp. DG1S-22]|uniref:hypothetical protein n=1 Tax=Lentzea sp. DG1S-22 TaxID=3108822 RepID=UPI002E76F3EE|nr:hypothetical protein [Lentzea sp. DG1S-22]WVH83949.1 hypothetical protein V1227_14735 [Lentzea sp. DG1S-22]
MAAAILDALGAERGAEVRAQDVLEALRHKAPPDVCLFLDDVHEVPNGSPGAQLLEAVARALPDTAHLVLSGRTVPCLPLARREAAGEVVRIDTADLAFTDAETSALAGRFGRELAENHGWPALIRLSLTAGPGASWRYDAEEVLSRLPQETRTTLAALVVLGSASDQEITAVAGRTANVEQVVREVPLADRLDDGRYRAHDLWATLVSTDYLRDKAVDVLTTRGDLAAAGRVASEACDWDLLARLAVELVRTTLSVLPSATAQRWMDAVPAQHAGRPCSCCSKPL